MALTDRPARAGRCDHGRPGAVTVDDARIRIELDIEQAEPLSGRVRRAGDDATRFVGWLSLLGVLADLVAGTSRAEGRPPAP